MIRRVEPGALNCAPAFQSNVGTIAQVFRAFFVVALISLLRNNKPSEETMATYKDLLAQKAKLEEQLEAARVAELTAVIQQVRQIVVEYELTAEDLGLAAKAKKRKGGAVAPKYQDPKSGATWTGRGRAPAWIAGKNFERFLIK